MRTQLAIGGLSQRPLTHSLTGYLRKSLGCELEGVFIPRLETELMVDLVSDVIEKNEELREGLWVDLGTVLVLLPLGLVEFLGSKGRLLADGQLVEEAHLDYANATKRRGGDWRLLKLVDKVNCLLKLFAEKIDEVAEVKWVVFAEITEVK
ncbi:hypothetical protein Patl1_36682 [Pistacia atlantica]|nr:hypothetical protein Patl1_36682 [Pistacia atlantica]